jgi:hypothetical protein
MTETIPARPDVMRHILGERECRRRRPLLRDRLVPRSCSAILRIIPMACKQSKISPFHLLLLLDSRVLSDQQRNERRQQRFAALAAVVHERKEPQGQREFLLGNTPMRTQPAPQV